jgi:hypothetical protein
VSHGIEKQRRDRIIEAELWGKENGASELGFVNGRRNRRAAMSAERHNRKRREDGNR